MERRIGGEGRLAGFVVGKNFGNLPGALGRQGLLRRRSPLFQNFTPRAFHPENRRGRIPNAVVAEDAVGTGQFQERDLTATEDQGQTVAIGVGQTGNAHRPSGGEGVFNPDQVENFDGRNVD